MPCPRFCPAKALARDCIAIGGFYAAKTFGNPTGGIRQGAVFDGVLELRVDVDPRKTGLWKGHKTRPVGL
jgi:hypothetical protein